MAGAGKVYMMDAGNDVYKIGRTATDGAKRRRTLVTGNPESLVVVKEWAVDRHHGELETLIHARFAENRLHTSDATEFFRLPDRDDAIATIDRIHADFVVNTADRLRVQDLAQQDDLLVDPDDGLLELIQRRRNLKARMQLLDSECAVVDAAIKDRIGQHAGVGATPGRQRPLASWKNIQTSQFDLKAFRRDHADLHARYSRASTTRRFCVHQ